MMRPLPALYLAFMLTGLAISSAAADPSEDDGGSHEAARIAGETGLKLYSATRWQEAFEAFQRAETAFHAPTLVLYMGHCQRMRGRLLDARSLYQRVASEPLGPGAPNQFLTAQLLARGELDRLRRRIPTLVLSINGARANLVRVTLDAAPLTVAPGVAQDIDPGDHTLIATAPGAAPILRTIKANEGATTELSLAFEVQPGSSSIPDSNPPPAPVEKPSVSVDSPSSPLPTTPGTPITPPSPSRFRGVPTSAWIAVAVGAAGLGVGAVTGVVALDEARAIKARCSFLKRCPATDQARADAAGRVADASTIAFLLGGAAAATGVVLWLALPPGGAASHAETSRLHINVGPGSLILEGAF